MTQIAVGFVLFLAVFYIAQVYMAWLLVRALRSWKQPRLADEDCPKAALVLCLRGSDPFLTECIERAASQDYPDYELHLVIDHETDPSVEVVDSALDRLNNNHVHVEYLRQPISTCSLKCSSLSQAVGGLDDSFEVVALLDADTLPHPTWLRELVAPLLEEGVGAATGNRWYMPEHLTVGAMVRYFWNCGAIIQMHAYNIAWGGSLAIRLDVVKELDLLKRWRRAFCEDTMLYGALRERGLQVRFVPSLIMVNRESCDLSGYYHWVCRQLLTARLYHPRWPAVVAHAVPTTAIPLVVVSLVVAAIASDNWWALGLVLGSSVVYGVLMAGILWATERAIRPIVAHRGDKTKWMSAATWIYFFLAMLYLQLLYPLALFSTLVARRVEWRGVEYSVRGSWDIRLVKYRPWQSKQTMVSHSL